MYVGPERTLNKYLGENTSNTKSGTIQCYNFVFFITIHYIVYAQQTHHNNLREGKYITEVAQ